VDAIIVGRRTVECDDPLLTARPGGPRVAARAVLDSQASLAPDSQLVRTAAQAPVLVFSAQPTDARNGRRLAEAGCEVIPVAGSSWTERLPAVLNELGRRRMTNVLVEGGPTTLSGFWDAGCVDEVHVFVAPKLLGGAAAPSPLAGCGAPTLSAAWRLHSLTIESLDGDVHIGGRVAPPAD
jgi:diaminohydroxyphosphoribosylaminopyrimidine deaminase/5-amino-6-(5-phosphoribosylamino)uracil reductase